MLDFDVIVIGGGHAGAEAATMAARSGVRTLLVTQQLESIGQMSCNPAIGGIAKGTVAREVDALGGIMGRATDRACIQFRLLNRSKGPAVWSPRAQCDRALYRRAVRSLLERQLGLHFLQGTVASLTWEGTRVTGIVLTDGSRITSRATVITAGTFLRGSIHVGSDRPVPAGRAGEPPSVELSQAIQSQGLTAKRFKTGTPPRIDGRTAELQRLIRQDGEGPSRFSFHEVAAQLPQLPCYLTYAGAEVKEVIQRHLSESALYGGAISGRGPRYCPSVEDKIVKFPMAERHQVFLEPEGLDTSEMYVNGLSTSLPATVQLEFLRLVPGLERVHMTRAGYAIEYDYFPPTQLDSGLAVRGMPGLFLAGQINGTTGYEEAAGQGVVAGINSALYAKDMEQVRLGRDQAFIGVLIDDLITRGVDEPYRLFTSRAEYRLLLRQENALRRLRPLAEKLGLLSDEELRLSDVRLREEDSVLNLARSTAVEPRHANPILRAAGGKEISEPTRAHQLVKRPGVGLEPILSAQGLEVQESTAEWAEIEIKYEGYLARERELASELSGMEDFEIPESTAYGTINAISFEAREKLAALRPATLGQAARVPGVSPSDLQSLVTSVTRSTRR